MTKSISAIKERLKVFPDDAQAHWQYGCALAFTGNWEEAWPEMQWRFKGHQGTIAMRQKYPKPDWDGSLDKRLLVYQDQGLGDCIQYVRYLTKLKCPYVIEVVPELYRLFKLQNFNVVMRGYPLPEYDAVVPVCSLPHYFGHIFGPHSYLVAPNYNKLQIDGYLDEKKIGISWAGNPDYFDDGHRSCEPSEFMALADCGELVSLMIRKSGCPFVDFSMKLSDFADTADLIRQLDCVVTVDTAVGHLAAALGKPVFLALSYEHDWRWMADKETTPWYPTMRLIRQKQKNDWNFVFNEIKKLL